MTASYAERRRHNLCGVETTPGERCLRGFDHPGQHVDEKDLVRAFRNSRVIVGGRDRGLWCPLPSEAERLAGVVVALLASTS